MKKTSSKRPETVDEYLATVPQPARRTLQKLRATIRGIVPAETAEGLYYGMPVFRYRGALVCYAAFKEHCSFFPLSARLLDEFKDDVAGYETSKGTIRFALDKPLPKALVRKLVKARMRQNEAKKRR